jgi:transcriptional regulator GlxA family with amidase domain
MNLRAARRRFATSLAGGLALAAMPAAAQSSRPILPPKTGKIPVAIVLTDYANLIDFSGPWSVFSNVRVKGRGNSKNEDVPGDDQYPFHCFTVGDSTRPLTIDSGLTITPEYTFDDAPLPRVVVVGAQRGSPKMKAWLQKAAANPSTDVIMSVCTGAFKLAGAGLLDGKPATTHHGYYDELAKNFPQVKVKRGLRFVESDPHTFTAGGLTSGFDLALHVVSIYFGKPAAQQTADWLEYRSQEWRTH